jgi:hypothetical protein
MRRQPYPLTLRCAHEGCKEYARYEFDYRRAYAESFEMRHYVKGGKPWLCVRHSHGSGVLTPENLRTEWTSPASKPLDGHPQDPYRSFGSSGVLMGPGFYVNGSDFPTGTRIRVTAEAVLPEAAPVAEKEPR